MPAIKSSNVQISRPFGDKMGGKPPLQKFRDLSFNLPEEFALLPPVILDDVSTFWAVRRGNGLLPLTL